MWIEDRDGDLVNLMKCNQVVLNNALGGKEYYVTAFNDESEVPLFQGSKQDCIAYMDALKRGLSVIILTIPGKGKG